MNYNPIAQPLLYIYIVLLYRNRDIIELKQKMLRLDIRRRFVKQVVKPKHSHLSIRLIIEMEVSRMFVTECNYL